MKNLFLDFLFFKTNFKKYGRGALVFFLYLILYSLVFLQLPLSGSLPGDYDTWYHLGTFYDNLNQLHQAFGIEDYGFTPDSSKLASGYRDSDLGIFIIQYPLYLIFKNDLWWYWAMMVVIFSLNACAFYSLFNQEKGISGFHFLKGMAFSSLGYFFGNMDGINVIFIAPLIFAAGSFIRLNTDGGLEKITLTTSGLILLLIGGIFSVYSFLNFILILSVLILAQSKTAISVKGLSLLSLLLVSILIGGFIFLTVSGVMNPNVVPTIDVFASSAISIHPADFYTPIKGTLFNRENDQFVNYSPLDQAHIFYPGMVVYVGALISLLLGFKSRVVWLALFVIGLVIGLGSFLQIGEVKINLPMYWFYKFISPNFYRVPLRANLILLFSLIVLLYVFLISVRKINYGLAVFLLLVVLFENLPIQFPQFGSDKMISYQPITVIKHKIKYGGTVLNMPYAYLSEVCTVGPEYRSSSIENIYGYWFSKNRINTANEITSVTNSSERIRFFRALNKAVDDGTDARALLLENRIDYLAVHNRFVCEKDKEKIERMIDTSALRNVYSDSIFSLWQIQNRR